MVCYLRYRKLRPEQHAQSKFKMPGGVWMSYIVLIFLAFALVILSLEPDTFNALKVSPLWLVILSVTYYVLYRPRVLAAKKAALKTQ